MGGTWRQRAAVLVGGLLCLATSACGTTGAAHSAPAVAASPTPTASSAAPLPGSSPPVTDQADAHPPAITYPVSGPGTFDLAPNGGPIAGQSGTLLSYRVAVEHGIAGIDAAGFAEQVSTVLDDPRGWTATGHWRLRLVPASAHYDFTIYLVTPATRDQLCGDGYDRYTSCRKDNRVVLNVARWVRGVPNYGASLAAYHEYMINHETGHRLGHGHELCPGPGQPAPVMEQQTLGLHGCVANSWPIVDGRSYAGRSGQYSDPLPADS
jgi:hypothetical protein